MWWDTLYITTYQDTEQKPERKVHQFPSVYATLAPKSQNQKEKKLHYTHECYVTAIQYLFSYVASPLPAPAHSSCQRQEN
jgi:hypothetical protein